MARTFYIAEVDGDTRFEDVTLEIVSQGNLVNGHFYSKDGSFQGKVNKPSYEGNNEDVYVCDGKGELKDSFVNSKKLSITHTNFCYIAGVVKAEDSSTFESAAATTQATFNAVKFEKGENLTMEEQSKYSKKLLSINNGDKVNAYSTVPSDKKTPLDDDKDTTEYKNARKALIHVLEGKKDFSEGAVLWDGIDFAEKGINHNKATKEGGISISKDLWVKFINNCKYVADKKGVLRLARGKGEKDKTKEEALATIPFEEKKSVTTNTNVPYFFDLSKPKNTIWDVSIDSGPTKNIDFYETLGTSTNSGRTLHKATVVFGGHIFWKLYKDHPNNKGYLWKYYMNHKL